MSNGTETPSSSTPSSGSRRDLTGQVLGDFEILRILGRGGMGEVYLAKQKSLKRNVALKVLRQDLGTDESYLRRFEAEAMAVAPISHANIVSVFAIGEEDDIHYIAMEYVQGTNLREYIRKKGTLEYSLCLTILRKVASALGRASEEGIIHRDIKPENVLLTKKGEVKVADFGLCRQVTDVRLTQSGVTMGTPLYMSPEQVEGMDLDHRTDLYSLGVTCYHMMAGEPPFTGETAMAVALQHLTGKAMPLSQCRPDLPIELIRIVEKMMAKDREFRYQTAKEILRDLAILRVKDSTQAVVMEDAGSTLVGDANELFPALTQSQSRSKLSQTFESVTQKAMAPRLLPWTVVCSLLLALGLGVALGFSGREPNHLGKQARQTRSADRSLTMPAGYEEIVKKEKKPSGEDQLKFSLENVAEQHHEAALWAVVALHPKDEGPAIEAARELLESYWAVRDFSRAHLFFDHLIGMEGNDDPKLFGYLFRGITLSLQGDAEQSKQSFEDALGWAKIFAEDPIRRRSRKPIPQDQLAWLQRQFFASIERNAELGAGQDPESVHKKFWDYFRPSRYRGDPRRQR